MNLKRFLIPGIAMTMSLAISAGVLASSKGDILNTDLNNSAAPSVTALAAKADERTAEPSYPAGVSSEKDYGYAKKGYRNAYEEIMAKDGFLYGIEYDWVDGNMDFAWSLGNNELTPHGSAYSENKVFVDLYNMKALGFNTVNMWLFQCLQGLKFDYDKGYVTELDDTFRKNLTSFLNIARSLDLKIVLSIQPHGRAGRYGVPREGLSYDDLNQRYLQFYYNPAARKAYFDNAVTPLCEDIIKYYQDTVIICDLTVENGATEVDDDEIGMYAPSGDGTTWKNFADFVKGMNTVVKNVMPDMMTSCEDMYYANSTYKYNDLGLDLHGYNFYGSTGVLPDAAFRYSNTPMYISEVNVTEDFQTVLSGEYWTQKQMAYYTDAQKKGYIGCFYFSWWCGAGNFIMFTDGTLNYDSMRNVAVYYNYQFNDLKNQYHGKTDIPDNPVLLANRGGSDVYWIPGRSMERFRLERSDDGGKVWKTVADNLRDGEGGVILKNGLYKYTDSTLKAGINYQYRVTAYNDEKGISTVSDPNNREELYVPKNIAVNGGFEDVESYSDFPSGTVATAEADSGWYRANGTVGAISTADAHSGKKCLEIDTRNGKGAGGWTKLNQKITVTPGALYEARLWFKDLDTSNTISFQARVPDTASDGETLGGSYAMKREENPDPELEGVWREAKFTFTAPQEGEIILGIWNTEWGEYYKCKIDDVEVKELR